MFMLIKYGKSQMFHKIRLIEKCLRVIFSQIWEFVSMLSEYLSVFIYACMRNCRDVNTIFLQDYSFYMT